MAKGFLVDVILSSNDPTLSSDERRGIMFVVENV